MDLPEISTCRNPEDYLVILRTLKINRYWFKPLRSISKSIREKDCGCWIQKLRNVTKLMAGDYFLLTHSNRSPNTLAKMYHVPINTMNGDWSSRTGESSRSHPQLRICGIVVWSSFKHPKKYAERKYRVIGCYWSGWILCEENYLTL